MKKRIVIFLLITTVLLIGFCSCSGNEDEYDVGSGTASRAEISYPDPEPSGMQFESSLVISGDWTIVSN